MATETLTNFTYNDLLEMPDDGRHYEILDGELIVNAAPIPRHQRIAFRLATILDRYVEANHTGMIYTSPIDVVFTQRWVMQPDILYIGNNRKSIVTEKNISGAPDLAVEVLSASTRKKDEIIKRRAYENFGVSEYWIIDPELESIKIYRRNDAGRYDRVAEASTEIDGASINSPLFPDLTIPLAEIFAE
jgi:Uma2 family endonuclease